MRRSLRPTPMPLEARPTKITATLLPSLPSHAIRNPTKVLDTILPVLRSKHPSPTSTNLPISVQELRHEHMVGNSAATHDEKGKGCTNVRVSYGRSWPISAPLVVHVTLDGLSPHACHWWWPCPSICLLYRPKLPWRCRYPSCLSPRPRWSDQRCCELKAGKRLGLPRSPWGHFCRRRFCHSEGEKERRVMAMNTVLDTA